MPFNSNFCPRSIESLTPQELLPLIHHPAASRIIDAIIDGPTIPSRSRRALPSAMEAQFADIFDDRIGARVGVSRVLLGGSGPISQCMLRIRSHLKD